MSRTLNKVMMIGNVGTMPEMRTTPQGVPITTFRIATTDTWKGHDGSFKEHTDWHTVVAWRGLAEIINKIVTKGSRVYVEGKLQNRNYIDKAGVKKQFAEILADNVLILDYRKKKESEAEAEVENDLEVKTTINHVDTIDDHDEVDESQTYYFGEKDEFDVNFDKRTADSDTPF